MDVDGAARDGWLAATDAVLIAACDVHRYRASGPGGQHRNKTESAVRLRHRATGVTAIGEDGRVQHENQARALRRLRGKLAHDVRAPAPAAPSAVLVALVTGGTARLGEKTRLTSAYLIGVAHLLDGLAARGGELAATAAWLGVTTGSLSKLVLHDPDVGGAANAIRERAGLRRLR